jgi:hypothetical protein
VNIRRRPLGLPGYVRDYPGLAWVSLNLYREGNIVVRKRRSRAKVETPAEELARLTGKPASRSAEQTEAESDAQEEVRQLQARSERRGRATGGPVEGLRGGDKVDVYVFKHLHEPNDDPTGSDDYGYQGSGYGVTKRKAASTPNQRWAGAAVPLARPVPGTIWPVVYGLIPNVAWDLGLRVGTVEQWYRRGKLGDLRDPAKGRPLVATCQVEALRIAGGISRNYDYLGDDEGYCTGPRRSWRRRCEPGCSRCDRNRRERSRGIRWRRNRRWDDEPTRARESDGLPDDWWRNDERTER